MRVLHGTSLGPEWRSVRAVGLGVPPNDDGSRCLHVGVMEDEGTPVMRVEVWPTPDAAVFVFTDAQLWKDWVAIGYGNTFHLVRVRDGRVRSHFFQHYFGSMVGQPDCLLVATSDHLHRIEPDGTQAWQSPQLGLDGVVVHEVAGDVISGDGEWDPPGGWKPFRLSLRTGAPL